MPVTDVRKDTDHLTMEITAEFDAPVDRVWKIWDDPRQLERWWGPPEYPATFVQHDLSPGGTVTYYMTGPEGEKFHGYWTVDSVDAPKLLTFDDGFADEHDVPNPEMPVTHSDVTLEAIDDGRTRMVMTSTFPTLDALEQLVAMGMEDGLKAAMGQIDNLLAERSS